MAEAASIAKRLSALESERSPHESVWRNCYNRTFPLRASGLGSSQLDAQSGQAKQAELLDGTGTESARTLGSALMSGLTPSNSRWASQEVDQATDEERRWLDASADLLWRLIHSANYDSQGYEIMLDLVCAGWGALYIDEAKGGGFSFHAWPLAEVFCATTSPGGRVDTVLRKYQLTAETAVSEFGGDNLSEQTRKLSVEKPDEKVDFVHAVYPRKAYKRGAVMARNLPIESCHVEVKARKIVRESGYHEFPIMVPRWSPIPRSVYGVGPAYEALPDMNMLNELKGLELAAADVAVSGMWLGIDDGVLNPRTVKIGPRKIVVAAEKDSLTPLTSGADFNVAFTAEERLQGAIRRRFMADQLQPQDGPNMTATEVHVRVQMIRQLLGPVYGRLQSDYLQPLWERCFGLALRAGALGDPPDSLVRGDREIHIKYISPVARAQSLEDVNAMNQFELILMQEAQARPEVLDLYDWDNAARLRGQFQGVPAQLLIPKDAVEKIRDGREQDQANAQKQALVGEMATKAAPQIAAQAMA